jgi:hypothetical protein
MDVCRRVENHEYLLIHPSLCVFIFETQNRINKDVMPYENALRVQNVKTKAFELHNKNFSVTVSVKVCETFISL